MIDYITEIPVPYEESQRDTLQSPFISALVIMDNFKGQITPVINLLLDEHNIHVCLLPWNKRNILQPLDIAVNKPAKDFLKRKVEDWYNNPVTKELQDVSDIDSAVIQSVNLSMAAIKELSAKWLLAMSEYIAENLQFNGQDPDSYRGSCASVMTIGMSSTMPC